MAEQVEIKYTFDRATKNMVKFDSEGNGAYYLSKSAWKTIGEPNEIVVTITSADQ